MKDELDEFLKDEPEIEPSSGFSRRVMAAVRQQAAEPPPIPFPWTRVIPGMVLCGIGLIVAFVYAVRQPRVEHASTWSIPWPHFDLGADLDFGSMTGLGWVAFSLALTFIAAVWSMRFVSRKA